MTTKPVHLETNLDWVFGEVVFRLAKEGLAIDPCYLSEGPENDSPADKAVARFDETYAKRVSEAARS